MASVHVCSSASMASSAISPAPAPICCGLRGAAVRALRSKLCCKTSSRIRRRSTRVPSVCVRRWIASRATHGALGWLRVNAGAWEPLALGAGGQPRGILLVSPEEEDELRAFCNLVSRRAPVEGELSWALRRFELGCERDDPLEGLTDHL